MVGMVVASSREKASELLDSAKLSPEIPSKLKSLRLIREVLFRRDPSLLPDFVHRLVELQTDRVGPARKLLAEMIGDIGLKHMEFIPEIVPVLISFLEDDTPAVTRQAILSGTYLFKNMLEKVAIQGLFSGELNELESSCAWMMKFKDAVYPLAFQPGVEGVRLMAVKFIEAMILLYTPDPDSSLQPPPHQSVDGNSTGFDISWLRSGHPILNIRDLATEASQSLDLLLDQLRPPLVKSLSNSIVVVFVNSLSMIAKRRPAFYGRILPVLLGLDPSFSVVRGVRVPAVHYALKNACLACLKCPHPGAVPWRDRLVDALKGLKTEELAVQAMHEFDKTCESSARVNNNSYPAKIMEDDKALIQECEPVNVDQGRKRSILDGNSNNVRDDDDKCGKRVKSEVVYDYQSQVSQQTNPNLNGDKLSLPGLTAFVGDGDDGHVQQLVAMFGALVAQGDKAAGPFEMLFSSVSSDLLAKVVMTNMQHLPPTCPKDDGEELPSDLCLVPSLVISNAPVIQSSSFSSDALSLSNEFPQIASFLSKLNFKNEQQSQNTSDHSNVFSSANDTIKVIESAGIPDNGISSISTEKENDVISLPSDISDGKKLDGEIPGLYSSVHVECSQHSMEVSHPSTVDQQLKQEPLTSSGSMFPLDFQPSCSTSTSRSEILNPKMSFSDAKQIVSSSGGLPNQFLLPRLSVPIVELHDEQVDHIQKSAYMRTIEAYKQIAIVSGDRLYLLAHLGVEYPLELDVWGLLREHISSEFSIHEGHELTLHVLYRLFREAEQDNDFFSYTNATSVYETFLLAVAETLRDSLPASDKSLSRLLSEVPYVPKKVIKLLESLCSPGSDGKIEKEFSSGDRVTQGLSAVWNLISLRPFIRDDCLKIALKSAVHQLEEVRMKAIRLVANKLYPMPCISQQIEDFANEMLLSVVNNTRNIDGMDTTESTAVPEKEINTEVLSSVGKPTASTSATEAPCDVQQISSQNLTASAFSEAQRCMSLYFALCTKKHTLLRQIFVIYETIPKSVKQAVHRQIPILVRTIGSSPVLFGIISDPPVGSENLLMQVLHTLTDGTVPSPELVSTVRKLYESKLKDIEFLIPVLSFLTKDEILNIFPRLVGLPLDKFQNALGRLLQGSSHTSPPLSPAEVLIAIHGIDPERDGIPLKKVTDACSACFEQRQAFTQQVLAKVLNQLVEQIPLPLLYMRTVIQAIGIFPALVDFVMEILSRLVNKQIWKYPKLWVGFLKCALQMIPQSFPVLLQLPAAQLENALSRSPALRAPLTAHASQSNIQSALPRSTLQVLGIAPESSQTGVQAHGNQKADSSNSGLDAVVEVAQDAATTS